MSTSSPLLDLIALNGDVPTLLSKAEEYTRHRHGGVDPTTRPLLRVGDLEHSLATYAEGLITREQLEAWASVLEMNDYIDYETGMEREIAQVLFELATPELHEKLSPSVARRLLERLGKVKFS